MNRKIMLAFLLIMAVSTLSILSVKPAFAETSIPMPYVPEFSVTYIASSYTVSSTNQYTGATVTTTYPNDTVQIVILNQGFNPIVNGSITVGLYYNVQEEGHFSNGDDWVGISSYSPANNSEYTVINYVVGTSGGMPQVPAGGQVDFQVQAFIGYGTQVFNPTANGAATGSGVPLYYNVYTGEKSAWSNTQTITATNGSTSTSISANSPYPTYSPTPIPASTSTLTSPNTTVTPQNPTTGVQTKIGGGFNWTRIALFGAIAVIVALVIAVVALARRNERIGKK